MELIKQTEQYKLNWTIDEWVVTGTVYNNINGSLSVNCTVSSPSGQIGAVNYSKPVEGNSNISFEVSETNRKDFAIKMNDLIDQILANFK
jgi:hypothetical protein